MNHEHHHHPHPGHENHKHQSTAEGAIYTCPMHPQIRQVGPGNCPICGMTLEPLVTATEETPSAELADITRRFWVGLALTVPVFVLEMGGHFFDLHLFRASPVMSLKRSRFRGRFSRRSVVRVESS